VAIARQTQKGGKGDEIGGAAWNSFMWHPREEKGLGKGGGKEGDREEGVLV